MFTIGGDDGWGVANVSLPGDVGIGTSSPVAKLDVSGGNMRISRLAGDTLSTRLELYQENVANNQGKWIIASRNTPNLGFYNMGYLADVVTLLPTGQVGFSQMNPLYPIHMASGAYVTAGGVWTNASSKEFKENIRDLSGEMAIDALGKLTPVTFNYKVDTEEKHVGFIAEDAPDLVASKDRTGLSPMDIVAVLTKVVQEQQKEIEKLKAEITYIKMKN